MTVLSARIVPGMTGSFFLNLNDGHSGPKAAAFTARNAFCYLLKNFSECQPTQQDQKSPLSSFRGGVFAAASPLSSQDIQNRQESASSENLNSFP